MSGDLAATLARGRVAVAILESPPEDPDHGYTSDEQASQYAAVDRLVSAFKELDAALVPSGTIIHTPKPSVNVNALFNT